MAVLNDEQEMLRDMARDWASNESPVTEFRKVRASAQPQAFDTKAYGTMAEMGWTGVIIPEEHGGSDFGFMSAGLVVEELGKTLTASPLIMNTVAASAIILGGSDEQRSRWLPKLASGEAIATLAIDESGSHDPANIDASVTDDKLSGTKVFVAEAHAADLFVVAAQNGLYLVEKGKGVSLATRKLTDQRSHADVTFDGAAADKLQNGGDSLLEDVLDRARILIAAEMLGMAQQVFDETLDYLKQRVQFNQVLATFQALQHRMADLFGELAQMRSAVEGGLLAVDSGFGVARAATIAKAEANRVLHHVTNEGIQLHGGMGMTDEYNVGFYLKRARVLEASFGSTSWCKDRFARLSGY